MYFGMKLLSANIVDLAQMPHSADFELGLHCFAYVQKMFPVRTDKSRI